MNPEELSLPEEIQEALYRLLGEGWDNSADAIVAHIDQQAATIETLKAALIDDRATIINYGVYPKTIEELNRMSEEQLAQEFPAIFGEAKE